MTRDLVVPAAADDADISPDEVRLADVTADNWRDVVALDVEPQQRHLLASNLYSLAEASFTPAARPRAIYAGPRLVGFIMYEPGDTADERHRVSIYRFMIDRRFQGRGFGRAALLQAIEEIRAMPGITIASICYAADNPAKVLYESLGFVPVDCDEDGDVIADRPLEGFR